MRRIGGTDGIRRIGGIDGMRRICGIMSGVAPKDRTKRARG